MRKDQPVDEEGLQEHWGWTIFRCRACDSLQLVGATRESGYTGTIAPTVCLGVDDSAYNCGGTMVLVPREATIDLLKLLGDHFVAIYEEVDLHA